MALGTRTVELPDGATILVRPVQPDDAEALAEAFARLSPDSRYRRFLSSTQRLSARTLEYLVDVDHVDHEALVALDAETDAGVGIARYIRLPEAPDTAEVAVTVADDWHGRGVGTALVALLVDRARAAGIARFGALVLADNRRMLALLEEFGTPRVVDREGGTTELVVDLPPAGVGGDLRALLRDAAGGALELSPDSRAAPSGDASDR